MGARVCALFFFFEIYFANLSFADGQHNVLACENPFFAHGCVKKKTFSANTSSCFAHVKKCVRHAWKNCFYSSVNFKCEK